MSDDMDEHEVAAAIAALAGALGRDMARLPSRKPGLVEAVSDDEATMTRPVGAIFSQCSCGGGNGYPREVDSAGNLADGIKQSGEPVCIACGGSNVVAKPDAGRET